MSLYLTRRGKGTNYGKAAKTVEEAKAYLLKHRWREVGDDVMRRTNRLSIHLVEFRGRMVNRFVAVRKQGGGHYPFVYMGSLTSPRIYPDGTIGKTSDGGLTAVPPTIQRAKKGQRYFDRQTKRWSVA